MMVSPPSPSSGRAFWRIAVSVSVIILAGVVAALLLEMCAIPNSAAPFSRAGAVGKDLALRIDRFYREHEISGMPQANGLFADFVKKQSKSYSVRPRDNAANQSNDCIRIFLLLPASLHSDAPRLIAYSDIISAHKQQKRFALFLSSNDIVTVLLDDHVLISILNGLHSPDNNTPLLYYYHRQAQEENDTVRASQGPG